MNTELKDKLKALLISGSSEFKAKQDLIDEGFDRNEIDGVLEAAKAEYLAEKNKNSLLYIGGGLGIVIIGLGLTFYSYTSAEPGEAYSIYAKPIILGGIGLVYGLVKRFV